MAIADTFDQACDAHGVEILYMRDGVDPLPFKALFEDYGNGPAPAAVDERFKRGVSNWAEFSFSVNRLPDGVEPESDNQIRVGDVVYTVRQIKPTHVAGEVAFWDVYANTTQRRS